jgi:hypothetical protein
MSRPRRLPAYLAILAIALQALWPLLAQAKPKNVVLVPVCTVQGVTHYIELPKGNAPVEQKTASQHDHCSFCTGGGDRIALAANPADPLLLKVASSAPRSTDHPFLESQKHFHARSRAPPAAR